MLKTPLLPCLLIGLFEGFAGLGVEIYAIRVAAIYIGSSTAITGVILAMLLVAIALGYWQGGKLCEKMQNKKATLQKAGLVLSVAAFSHAVACLFQIPAMEILEKSNVDSLFSAVLVGTMFGIGMAFASASIPLLTQFLTLNKPKSKNSALLAGEYTGVMVAMTTVGSALGSTLTPIIMLPDIGLKASLMSFVIMLCMASSMATALSLREHKPSDNFVGTIKGNVVYCISALSMVFIFSVTNHTDTGIQTPTTAWFIIDGTMTGKDNYGHKARGLTDDPRRTISSCWDVDTQSSCGWYAQLSVNMANQLNAQHLLYLGGAGMVIPLEYASKHPQSMNTVVDIDEYLPSIVEARYLKKPLPNNVHFVAKDARRYVTTYRDTRYDFALIDVFHGLYVASNVYSKESLQAIKASSRHVVANIIAKPSSTHGYTQSLLATWVSVFGRDSYVITEKPGQQIVQNMMLCNYPCGDNAKNILSESYFVRDGSTPIHTDNLPVLDQYEYRNVL